MIKSDNIGALFIIDNDQVSNRTKHIDVRHHFIKDLRKNGDIEVEHVKSEDNVSDILTKNTSTEIFNKLSGRILNGKCDDTRENDKYD